jgi:hypothetical protein
VIYCYHPVMGYFHSPSLAPLLSPLSP